MNFTVVIPTCRRPDSLARCLKALPRGVEIIVTDDSGDDATRAMIAELFPHVRHIAGPRRGPAANRNHGARAASGEWLAFTDDDCEPQPGWLDALAASAEDAGVVEGRTDAPGAIDSPLEEYVESEGGGAFWSCNLGVRRDLFFSLGGFDEDFKEAAGEDMEFAWRVARAKLRVSFAPAAIVHHPSRRVGWRGVWKRIWMIRWMSLYRLKTGGAPELGAAPPQVAWALLVNEGARALRTALHSLTRHSTRPLTQRFYAILRLLTLPLVLPCMLAWEFHFRRILSARLHSATPSK